MEGDGCKANSLGEGRLKGIEIPSKAERKGL